jgi:hypothetical protein
VYKCNNRTWVPVSASAILVNISDSKISLGSYSLEYSPAKPKLVGTWNLSNNDADTSESGSPISIVAGISLRTMHRFCSYGNYIQVGLVVIKGSRS